MNRGLLGLSNVDDSDVADVDPIVIVLGNDLPLSAFRMAGGALNNIETSGSDWPLKLVLASSSVGLSEPLFDRGLRWKNENGGEFRNLGVFFPDSGVFISVEMKGTSRGLSPMLSWWV